MTKAELQEWATQVAKDHGVELMSQDGQSVLLADAVDGFKVAFRAVGVRGRQYVASEISANATKDFAKMEMRMAIEALVSITAIPSHVKIVSLGAYCDAHGYSDEDWPIVNKIDREAWTYTCTVGTNHDLPEVVGLMADGVARVERK